ncbi:MAG: site-specific DNA-methyltransferase, partial [Candidatus Atribacteria bacterium]|nr:site-specific DNA-methyltransferase [Candidatus Atribacteria bacterium]
FIFSISKNIFMVFCKMIYIDPPYNTGNDFIYPDDYKENLKTYLQYTGQIDAEGKKFSTNTDTEGRFHSKWLNMMYPRLFLAKNLLSDNGVVFISIDDNEVSNLRKICDEIFGEENFIALLIWKCRAGGGSDSKYFAKDHEYVLAYTKNEVVLNRLYIDFSEEEKKKFNLEDNRGRYFLKTLERPEQLGSRPNLQYKIILPDGSIIFKKTKDKNYTWVVSEAKFKELRKEDRIVFKQFKDKWMVFRKLYLYENDSNGQQRKKKPRSILDKVGLTRDGGTELKKLLGNRDYYSFPKPPTLIKHFISIVANNENDIILDFFAGSASTAHAVLDLNKEDDGNRKFIMVQLPEICNENSEAYKAGFKTIADIGKERIRRVIKNIEKETDQALFKNKKMDLGFKVFKLDKSNFKIWDAEQISPDKASIEKQLELHIDHINYKASQDDILYEILLKAGFELTTKIEKIKLAEKAVYSVEGGAMLICLEKELTKEVIKAMAEKHPSRVICLDRGFANNDQIKTNAVQIMKSKGVDDFRTV